ncbi:misacylated tRNA(Ala) deacylase [Rhizobium sp. ERR 1071]|uniref:alanyl-tRNA editing protein n=1 Tax=Rhizobium sp. ERR 1071 TaxID=2572677 RepID=UPI00119B79D8|nr:alanyl-tRNA editing protein [Rhizobium sp. ERR1071]TWB08262.1 misacylated tRNA(Ala) deacylase [Rhizobium sp. ERR1071]
MGTFLDFLDNAYLAQIEATILWRGTNRIIFDRTIFYPAAGASVPDSGEMLLADGRCIRIKNSQWHDGEAETIEHICEEPIDDLILGEKLRLKIDWPRRYAAMRAHTALYLVSLAFPYPVVETLAGNDGGKIAFEVDNTGMHVDELERLVAELIEENLPLQPIWITERSQIQITSVPPIIWPGSNGQIRALKIGEFNVRSSDALHVRHTGEVGPVRVTAMERLADAIIDCEIRLSEIKSIPRSP